MISRHFLLSHHDEGTRLLLATGYCGVHLIGLTPDGAPCDYPTRPRIIYAKYPNSKPLEVPASDITFSHWNMISECHLIVVTVNSSDTKLCSEKLIQTLHDNKKIPIFSLQRGVKNSSLLKDEVESKNNIIVMEGVVGFAVSINPKTQALTPSTSSPALMLERISKEHEKMVEGPMNLLDSMKLEMYYRKTLTPYAWGVLMYECLYYVNAIQQGSLRSTLLNSRCRSILAMMTRECREALVIAAKQGSWKPDMLLITSLVSPWLWEMLLLMPTPIFYLIAMMLQLLPPDHISSSCYEDLQDKRLTSVDWFLGDMLKTGRQFNLHMQVCQAVHQRIKELEASTTSHSNKDCLHEVEAVVAEVRKLHHGMIPSNSDLMRFMVKVLAGGMLVVMLLYAIIVLDW